MGDAAKVAGDVADHRRQQPDEEDAAQEGGPAASTVFREVVRKENAQLW